MLKFDDFLQERDPDFYKEAKEDLKDKKSDKSFFAKGKKADDKEGDSEDGEKDAKEPFWMKFKKGKK